MPYRSREDGGAAVRARRRAAPGLAIVIYLVAGAVPGLGAAVAWIAAWAWTRDAALARHYRRAQTIQAASIGAMLMIQASVVGLLAGGFPWGGPVDLRVLLVGAGLHLTLGVYLAMWLLGPLLVLGEQRLTVALTGERTAPPRPLAPSPMDAPVHRPAPVDVPVLWRVSLGERTTRRVVTTGRVVSAG